MLWVQRTREGRKGRSRRRVGDTRRERKELLIVQTSEAYTTPLNLKTNAMEGEESTTTMCTILAIDHTNLTYKACPVCERTQLDSSSSSSNLSPVCKFCVSKSLNPPSSSSSSSFKRLFRLLMSIATDTKVITVVCFDRVARVLFGCSADEFFDFAKLHPLSGPKVNEILEGEMFTMTLSKPKNGNARHLRVVSATPLRTGFMPAIEALREYHRR